LNYSRTTRISPNLQHLRSPCRINTNPLFSHHPLGPPSTSPPYQSYHRLLLVQRSIIRPLQTALLTSLSVSPNSRMNYDNLGPTTLLIDNTRVRPLRQSHPPPVHLLPHHSLTITPTTPTPTLTPATTPTLTPTPTPTPTPTH
jgi:hypothetical protein